MMGGVIHSKNVLDHVWSLSIMIPIFLVATNFYGKRSDIDMHRKTAYIDKSLSELLEYVILKDTPQQEPQSNDCGMFVCAFAEYVSHGIFDISSRLLMLSAIESDMVHYYEIMLDESRMMGQSVKVRQQKMLLESMVVSKDLGSILEVQGHESISLKLLQQ
ncbi:hypothetical protein P3S67_000274 [Capsicum chacoense]